MIQYDPDRLAREVEALADPAASTYLQGKKLQDLVDWLLGEVPGVTVARRNKHDAANTEEKDLWFEHEPWVSRLPFVDREVPVECKNEQAPASAEEVYAFGRKIRASGGRDGVLVTRSGLAGQALTSAHAAIRDELHAGCRIVVLTAADLGSLGGPQDLVRLVLDRHAELRMEQTYRSI